MLPALHDTHTVSHSPFQPHFCIGTKNAAIQEQMMLMIFFDIFVSNLIFSWGCVKMCGIKRVFIMTNIC